MVGRYKKIKVVAGKEAKFEALMQQLKVQMQLHEPDTIYYDLYKSPVEPGIYVMMERYKNQQALQAHEQSAHGAIFFPQIRPLLEKLEKECFESVD